MASAVITLTTVRPSTDVSFVTDYINSNTSDATAMAHKPFLTAANATQVTSTTKFVPNFDRAMSVDGLTVTSTVHVADISEVSGLSADSTSDELLNMIHQAHIDISNSLDSTGALAEYFEYRKTYNANNGIAMTASVVVTP